MSITQPGENLHFMKGDFVTSRLTIRRTRRKQLLEDNTQQENLEDADTPGLSSAQMKLHGQQMPKLVFMAPEFISSFPYLA